MLRPPLGLQVEEAHGNLQVSSELLDDWAGRQRSLKSQEPKSLDAGVNPMLPCQEDEHVTVYTFLLI